MTRTPLFALPLTLIAAGALSAAQPGPEPKPPANISYYTQVRPIFQQHCQGCHQPAKPQGGYVMTAHADLLKKGERDKPGVVPGKPQESYLLQLIRPADGKTEMPKGKDPLPEFQVKLIADWIAQGAVDDTPMSARAPAVDPEHPPVYQLPPVVTAVAFSPDGQLLAVSGYHEVLLHKADGSGLFGRLVGLSERIQAIAFAPDGKTLAVCGGDPGRFGEIQLWNLEKQKLWASIPVTHDTVYGISWSPDGTKVAVGCGDNTIRGFDIADGKQVLFQGAHADWVMGTAFSQDGKHLVSVSRDRSVKLTHVETQRFIDNITSITPGVLKGGLLTVDVRPTYWQEFTRGVALTGGLTRSCQLADLTVLHALAMPRKNLTPRDAPDVAPQLYEEVLVAGADGQPRLYKMHRENKRVIGDDFNKVREYEKFPGRVYAAAFNRVGNLFAAGSSLDGTGEARVYQVDTGKRVATFDGVKTPVYALAFRPDGQAVATAGFDGSVRLNDPQTGKLLKEFVAVPLADK